MNEGCKKEIDLEELYSKVNKKDRRNKDKLIEQSPDEKSDKKSWKREVFQGDEDVDCIEDFQTQFEIDVQTPPPLPPRPASLSSPGTPFKPTQDLGLVGGFKSAKSMSHDYQDISTGSDECCVTFRFETTGCAVKKPSEKNFQAKNTKHPDWSNENNDVNGENHAVDLKTLHLEILQAPLAITDPKRILDRDDSAIIIDEDPVIYSRPVIEPDSGFNEAGLVEALLVDVADFDEEEDDDDDDYDCFPSFLANAAVVRPFGSDILSAISEEEKVLYIYMLTIPECSDNGI